MHTSVEQLNVIKNKVKDIINKKQLKIDPKIIVVTKTFPFNKILPLLDSGHIHYGENKIQEAENKWLETKNRYKDLQLHMIGKLQTNKAKKAVKLFDYIHSLDNAKLALKLSQYQNELGKKIHSKNTDLDTLHEIVIKNRIEPNAKSGQQEMLENIINEYL